MAIQLDEVYVIEAMSFADQVHSDADLEPATLSIGEVAARTGMTVAGLRNWETRYGLPTPARSEGGQRRYRESDCRLITDVLRRRDSGLALGAAIEQARRAASGGAEVSIYAAVRRRHPELRVHTVSKNVLLALTWAIEDHCCAAAQSPVLVGAFQQTRFYRSARDRWRNMAATGDHTVVFADFDRPALGPRLLAEVPIAPDSPLQREWALVCDGPEAAACVLGWEPPGQDSKPDSDRLFEMVWSADPRVVREAARTAVGIASRTIPELSVEPGRRLAEDAPPASPDLQRAAGLLDRTLDYLARA